MDGGGRQLAVVGVGTDALAPLDLVRDVAALALGVVEQPQAALHRRADDLLLHAPLQVLEELHEK